MFGRLVETRSQFLHAVADLKVALATSEVALSATCEPIQMPPVFSFDLASCDSAS